MPPQKPILNYRDIPPTQFDWLLPVAIGAALVGFAMLGMIAWAARQAGC
jgi:hypothetical protein